MPSGRRNIFIAVTDKTDLAAAQGMNFFLADEANAVPVDLTARFLDKNVELRPECFHRDLLHLSTEGDKIWWGDFETHIANTIGKFPRSAPKPVQPPINP